MSDESPKPPPQPETPSAPPAEPEYPEDYYEYLARTMGEEQAAWARLPRAEREAELERLQASSNSPNDLALWPPELNGGT